MKLIMVDLERHTGDWAHTTHYMPIVFLGFHDPCSLPLAPVALLFLG